MFRLFQISLALLVSLAGINLAGAEKMPLAALTCVLAVGTLYFVDWTRMLRIPPSVLALLATAGFVAIVSELFIEGLATAAYTAAHLLVYLTWLILLQPKQLQHYWWLLAMSLLQVGVATVMTASIWFGIGLVAYFFLATWTLSIFLLCRSTQESQSAAPQPVSQRPGAPRPRTGRVWNGLSRNVDESLVSPRFVGSTLVVTCLSLVLSLGFFLYTPRGWTSDAVDDSGVSSQPLTGFTKDVQLGSLGEILESADHVMTVKLFHAAENREFTRDEYERVLGPYPLFRGAVLEKYERGRWQALSPRSKSPSEPADAGAVAASVREEITLQPIVKDTVLSFGKVLSVRPIRTSDPVVNRDVFSDEFVRDGGYRVTRAYLYNVLADPGSVDDWLTERWTKQLTVDPNTTDQQRVRAEKYLEQLRFVPENLSRIHQLTRTVIAGARDDNQAALKILAWLQDPKEFGYSMRLEIRDPTVDPLEDFLFNRREGHCEYFATAMAMMLRSAGIPARLISGLKGGTYSDEQQLFVIQQLHAHAWVEAFVNGKWKTFDPTPGVRNERVAVLEKGPSYLELQWAKANARWQMVARMNQEGQQTMLFQPLQEAFNKVRQSFADVLRGNESILAVLRNMTTGDAWSSGTGTLFFAAVILLIGAGAWLGLILVRLAWSLTLYLSGRSRRARLQLQQVAFFERFRSILRRQGIVQRPQQTAREFVRHSLSVLEPRLAARGMQTWPDDVVESFYRVRFGGQALSDDEAAELCRRLDDLDTYLKASRE